MPRFQPSPYSHRSALISMPTAAQMARLNAGPTMPTIRKGSKGTAVGQLHALLTRDMATKREVGISVLETLNQDEAPENRFGSATDQMVRVYQKLNNLGVDGIVGPNTWGSFGLRGSSIAAAPVAAVQSVLSSIIPTAAASTGLPAPAGGEEEKFYQKSWFLPVAISASVLLIGTIIILVKD